MGLFGSHEEKLRDKAKDFRSEGRFQYKDTIRPILAPKDGKLHVLMINTASPSC